MVKSKDKEALFGEGLDSLTKGLNFQGIAAIFEDSEEFSYVPIKSIIIDEQIRKDINLESESFIGLMNSIKEKGVLEPILVNAKGDKFLLVAGERRYRACEKLKFSNIPARILKDELDKNDILSLQLIENIHREDINVLDEAQAYFNYYINKVGNISIDNIVNTVFTYNRDKNRLNKEVAETVSALQVISGKSSRTLINILSLLKIPKEIQDAIRSDKIGVTHGYIFASNLDHPRFWEIANKALNKKLSKESLIKYFKEKEFDKKKKIVKKTYYEKVKNLRVDIAKNVYEIDKYSIDKLLNEVNVLKDIIEKYKKEII